MPIGRSRNTSPNWLPSRYAFFERAQVDRHQRADHHAVGRIALLREVSAQRAGDARQQHVVDRRAERLADRLDLVERQRLGPCDALRHRPACP